MSVMYRFVPKIGVRRLSVAATALQRPRIGISVVKSSRRWCTTAVSSPGATQSPQEHKAIAYWLLGMGGLVAGMVTIGGITRLTRSGLSMTDWKLQGSLPPMTKEDWEKEFERYKQFPEWQQRQRMTIEEFKFIYFWEYGHRMFGRFLGVAFTVPLVYFSARGMIPRTLYPRLGLLFGLGGTQGLIGWWMVKSGLNVDPTQNKEIRVSPYRLATHLGMAFTTYTVLIWTGLDLLNTPERARHAASQLSAVTLKHGRKIRWAAVANGVLVATTVASGAFVAGNDAGRAFNSFPMMGDVWIPEEIFDMQPLWRNFFENTALVQFDHRVLALTTLSSIWGTYAMARFGGHWKAFPALTRASLTAVTHMSLLQVGLGIATLLTYVPVSLGAIHQAGSLVLLTLVIGSVHLLNFTKYTTARIVLPRSALGGGGGGAFSSPLFSATAAASAAAAATKNAATATASMSSTTAAKRAYSTSSSSSTSASTVSTITTAANRTPPPTSLFPLVGQGLGLWSTHNPHTWTRWYHGSSRGVSSGRSSGMYSGSIIMPVMPLGTNVGTKIP